MKLYVIISGTKYDITDFVHPIAVDLKQYNNQDVSKLFLSLHDASFLDKLKKYIVHTHLITVSNKSTA
jgi:cytochrome b involved in lipid metabolism